jgi:hypothetical protein
MPQLASDLNRSGDAAGDSFGGLFFPWIILVVAIIHDGDTEEIEGHMDPRRTIRGQQEEAPAASASAVRAPPSSIDFVYSSSSFVPLLSLLRASILS